MGLVKCQVNSIDELGRDAIRHYFSWKNQDNFNLSLTQSINLTFAENSLEDK